MKKAISLALALVVVSAVFLSLAKNQVSMAQVDTETPTATETVAETPTATATEPATGTELVANGGFETDLTGWTLKNATGDKVKCDTETKVFAYEGVCAFKFKGGTGENSKLQQVLDLTAATPAAGDTLDLSAYINAKKETVSGKMKLVVKYADTTTSKATAAFVSSIEGYVLISGEQIVLTSADVAKVKLLISHKSPSGKAYLDAVSVLWNTTAVATETATVPAETATLVAETETPTDVPAETATSTDVPVETATPTETPVGLLPLP